MSSGWNASQVTPDGAAWLASAGTYPRSTLALWEERPEAPVVLPCGAVFDVVSAPSMFGRRMLDRLWDDGPGSGPVAEFRGRMLLFAAPGTAQRLPALLEWEEWGTHGRDGGETGRNRRRTASAVPRHGRRRDHPRTGGGRLPRTRPRTGAARHPRTRPRTGAARHPRTRPRLDGVRRPQPSGFPLARRPRHPAALAPGPRGTAVGGRAGGPFGGADFDFSSRRPGC